MKKNDKDQRLFIPLGQSLIPAARGPIKNNLKTFDECMAQNPYAIGRIVGVDKVALRLTGEDAQKIMSRYEVRDNGSKYAFKGLMVELFDYGEGTELVIIGEKTDESSSFGKKIVLNIPEERIQAELLTGNQYTVIYADHDLAESCNNTALSDVCPLPNFLKIKKIHPDDMDPVQRRALFITYAKDREIFLHNKMAELIIQKYNNTLIYFHGNFCSFNGKCYTMHDLTPEIDQTLNEWYPEITDRKANEVKAWLKRGLNADDRKMSYAEEPYTLNFKNGRVNVMTGEIMEFTPKAFDFCYVPHNYNPDAHSEVLDCFINSVIPDKNMQLFFWEMCGTIFCRKTPNDFEKTMLFYGPSGGNGKSTILDLINSAIKNADENVSSLSSSEFAQKFVSQGLDQKLVNLSYDDYFDLTKKESIVFKKAISSEPYTVQEKNKKAYEMTPFATCIFASNEIPKSKDTTGGFMRRLAIIPLIKKFKNTKDDIGDLKDQLKDEAVLEAFIAKSVKGIQRLTANGNKFTAIDSGEFGADAIRAENSSVSAWLEEYYITAYQSGHHICRSDILTTPRDDLYKMYLEWCEASQIRFKCNRLEFAKKVASHYELAPKQQMIKGSYYFTEEQSVKLDHIKKEIDYAFKHNYVSDEIIKQKTKDVIYYLVFTEARSRFLFSAKEFTDAMESYGYRSGGHSNQYFVKNK